MTDVRNRVVCYLGVGEGGGVVAHFHISLHCLPRTARQIHIIIYRYLIFNAQPTTKVTSERTKNSESVVGGRVTEKRMFNGEKMTNLVRVKMWIRMDGEGTSLTMPTQLHFASHLHESRGAFRKLYCLPFIFHRMCNGNRVPVMSHQASV